MIAVTAESLAGHESEWIGWLRGQPVRLYADRWAVDRALTRREIDSGSPVEHMIRNLAARAAREGTAS